MNIILKNIPNIFTLLNLLFGIVAIIFSFENLLISSFCIFIGIILDFFDGFFARLLNLQSDFGKQLDSFADFITSGLAPGFILMQLIYQNENDVLIPEKIFHYNNVIYLFGLLIPIFSAIRLAKFNIDENQKNNFLGLPTPAVAIFIASLPLITQYQIPTFVSNSIHLIFLSIILSFLLISNIPLFSFKISQEQNQKTKIIRTLFVLISIILLLIFQFVGIPFIVVLYLILSIINNQL